MSTSIVMPDEGQSDLLQYCLGKVVNTFAPWQLILWTNSAYTPSQSSVYADLIEATFGGYSRVGLTQSLWTAPTEISDQAVSTWGTTPVTWNVTGSPQTVYGYAIVTPSSPVIRAIQAFDSPIPLITGGVLGVLPRFALGTLPP